jgi:hypothetical protein
MEHLKAYSKKLQAFDWERKGWLIFSFFIAGTSAGIIFSWDRIVTDHIIWLVVSLGLLLSISWWYWSMRLVRFVLHYKAEESVVLLDIIEEIRDIKKSVQTGLTDDK